MDSGPFYMNPLIATSIMSTKKPALAYAKAIGWMLFTGTATLSAFILPVHIWALISDSHCGSGGCGYVWMKLDSWWANLYFFILIFAVLYHSFYRLRTLIFDFTLVKTARVLGVVLLVAGAGLMAMVVLRLYV